MHPAPRLLAVAFIVAATPAIARAQSYPALPGAVSQTTVRSASPSAVATCPGTGTAATTLADAASSAANCTFGAGTVGQTPSGGTVTFNPGSFQAQAQAASDPATNTVSASSRGSGMLVDGMRADGFSEGSQFFYVTVSDPLSVFRIALVSSSTLSSSVDPTTYDLQQRSANGTAVTQMAAFSVDADKNLVDYTGMLDKHDESNTHGISYVATQRCDVFDPCGYVDDSINEFSVLGSTLNADGIFGFYIRAATQFYHRNNQGGDYTGTETASAAMTATDILLYDAAGNRLYNTITIDRGAAVTTTPEPASLVLLATGLAGVVAARRRKQRA